MEHPESGNDSLPLKFGSTATNADGDSTGWLTVDIIDDVPDAVDITGEVVAAPNTNLLIVFDRSGSMDADPGVDGFSHRIDLVRAAVSRMLTQLDSSGELNIKIVAFNTRASSTDWFTGADAIADATAFLAGLTASDCTSYRSAINEVIDSYGTPPGEASDGFRNLSFFLTDGNPNPGRGLTDQNISDYQDFVDENDLTSYAVGVGNGVTADAPSFVAIGIPEITDGPLPNPTVVVNEVELADALAASLVALRGNVLAENELGEIADFAADGQGGLMSINVDGDLYEYDRDQDRILLNSAPFANGSLIAVSTALAAKFTFDFSNGDYTYTPTSAVDLTRTESFEFTLQDSDGDISGASLSIEVTPVGGAASTLSSVQALQAAQTSYLSIDPAESAPGGPMGNATILDEPGGDTILAGTMLDDVETFVDPDGMSSVVKLDASDVGGQALRVYGFDNDGAAIDGDRIDISDVLNGAGFDAGVHDLADFVQVSETINGDVALSIDLTGSGSRYQDVAILFAGDVTATSTGLADASLQQMLDDGVLIT